MSTYFRFVEENEHEGATWNFWLLSDGNEAELDRLADYLAAASEDDDEPQFMLAEDELTGSEVDLLVRFAEENYHLSHNKIDGRLSLPELLDDEFRDALYKGGIRDFFEAAS